MRQYLNNPWVVLGLCVVAVALFYFNTEEEVIRQALPSRALPLASSPLAEFKSLSHERSITDTTEFGWTTTFERDPFAPMTAQSKNPEKTADQEKRQLAEVSAPRVVLPALELSAVALEPAPKVAMINRKLVEEGDRVEGLRVAKIEADGVWLQGPSGRHHVGFKDSSGTTNRGERRSQEMVRTRRESGLSDSRGDERRTKTQAVLKDGRDCSTGSACS